MYIFLQQVRMYGIDHIMRNVIHLQYSWLGALDPKVDVFPSANLVLQNDTFYVILTWDNPWS